MPKVLVLNGPNLNLLGSRETDKYGTTRLDQVINSLIRVGSDLEVEVTHEQSNHEGEIIDLIQSAGDKAIDYIIINPGALTHTSVGLRDAFLGVNIPFVEVHISNIFAREEFRRHSYLSDIATGTICGCGVFGYELALRFVVDHLSR